MPPTPFQPDPATWDAWRPGQVHERFCHIDAPWYVAAGWAIDLFLGEQTREHEDIEIGVPASQFEKFAAALADCEIFAIDSGVAYPISGVPANGQLRGHQTWVRDKNTGFWKLDIFREPSENGVWVSRRDASIRMPYERLILFNSQGIPFARPEVVLSFKAKAARAKDEADLVRVLPKLDSDARTWLAAAIAKTHPAHRWLAKLS
jgi:hypothetical protein